jgi:hypothetical protein
MNYENFVSAVEGLALMYQRMNPKMCVSVNRTDYGLELTCMLKEQMRKEWIDQMLTEYSEEYEHWSEIILCDENRKIMVVQFDDCWGDRSGYGISKCSPTDRFDVEVGLAVAFAHFRGYPIPSFI